MRAFVRSAFVAGVVSMACGGPTGGGDASLLRAGTCSMTGGDRVDEVGEPPTSGANAGAWKAYWTSTDTEWVLNCGQVLDSWNARIAFAPPGITAAGTTTLTGNQAGSFPYASFTVQGSGSSPAKGTLVIDSVEGEGEGLVFKGSFDLTAGDGQPPLRMRGLFHATRP